MNTLKSFSLLRLVASVAVILAAAVRVEAQSNLPPPPVAQALVPTDEELFPDPSGPPAQLYWGASLAVRNDTALVGAPNYYGGATANDSPIGRVAVFSRDASGVWFRSGTLEPAAPEANEHFGQRVAVGKHLALVGSAKYVYVFRLSQGQWQQQQIQPNPGERLDGALGVAGGELFIGRSKDNAPGAVYVLGRSRGTSWQRVQVLHAPGGGSEGDSFGASLIVRGDSLVVGAPGAEDGVGAAFLFKRVHERWVRVATLKSPREGQAGAFGHSVALHGNLIAVGAPSVRVSDDASCFGYPGTGAAYVFRYVGGRWASEQEVVAPDAACYSAVGDSVGISHRYLAVDVPTNYPFAHGGVVVYSRTSAGYSPTYLAGESDWSATTLAMDGPTLLAARPYAMHFGSGEVIAYRLDPAQ